MEEDISKLSESFLKEVEFELLYPGRWPFKIMIIIILAIVIGIILTYIGFSMLIIGPIYIIGAIVAMIKSKNTKTHWLQASLQSWYYVYKHRK
jgi:Ca2+-dependent lipid-binding protein